MKKGNFSSPLMQENPFWKRRFEIVPVLGGGWLKKEETRFYWRGTVRRLLEKEKTNSCVYYSER